MEPRARAAKAERLLYEGSNRTVDADAREILRGFVDRTSRVLQLVEGFMPECVWLDDEETLTYLHSTISTKRHRVRVPEIPMYLDALLADQPLTGGLEPMLGWFGIQVPIKVLINQLSVTERIGPVMRTQVGIASGLLSLKQYPHGTVVIGGGWQGKGDRVSGHGDIVAGNVVGNIRLACHAIPALKSARLARSWTGFEAETADALPIVGSIPGFDNAYVCGSVHSGYTSGIYIGRLLAERLLGREPELPLFPIERLLEPPPSTTKELRS